MTEDQNELIKDVLAVTRDQLAKAMNLSAELEALLIAERRKNTALAKENSQLSLELVSFKEVDRRAKK